MGNPAGEAAASAPQEQACPALAKVLERLERPKPEILDLGPLCGESVVYLASRGGKVTVEGFEPPPPPVEPEKGESKPPHQPLHIEHPDDHFDLVLVWEQADFVAPEYLAELGKELRRILVKGGWLLLFSRASGGSDREPFCQYRIVADDRLVRQPIDGPARRRWNHPTRNVEQALAGFSVKGIHLQRNQIREFLAVKR